MRKHLSLLSLFLICGGCSLLNPRSGDSKESVSQEQLQMGVDVAEAARLNSQGDGKLALAILTPLRAHAFDQPNYRSFLFQLGEAQIQSQKYLDAERTFREFLNLSGPHTEDETLALYKLAFCYEGLGQDLNGIAALRDLEKRTNFSVHPGWRPEITMRLAGAYIRVGNASEASRLYKRADQEAQGVRRAWAGDKALLDRLGEFLFNMGNMAVRDMKPADFERDLEPLKKGQGYLIQAIDVGVDRWAERSTSALKEIYTHAYEAIQGIQPEAFEDETLALRNQQEQQKKLAGILMIHVHELKRVFLHSSSSQKNAVQTLAKFIKELEEKLDHKLSERPVGEGLTPEAVSRQSVKQEGQIIETPKQKSKKTNPPATPSPSPED